MAGDRYESGYYMGVRGTSARQFVLGDRIAVTLYNNSDQELYFAGLVSFTDTNGPVNAANEPARFGFTSVQEEYSTLPPRAEKTISYKLYDGSYRGQMDRSTGTYSSVNFSVRNYVAENSIPANALLVDKIEIFRDVDCVPPTTPAITEARAVSDSAIFLRWIPSTDNGGSGVKKYYIYQNDELILIPNPDSNNQVVSELRVGLLKPDTTYRYQIRAIDNEGNESRLSNEASARTNAFSHPGLINPHADLEYMGAFLPPPWTAGDTERDSLAYSRGGLAFKPGRSPRNGEMPGSLFAVGHNAYRNVAEFAIPAPRISGSKNAAELPPASYVQRFSEVWNPANQDQQIRQSGLAYLPRQGNQSSSKLYGVYTDEYYQANGTTKYPVHFWFDCDLSAPNTQGPWYIGQPSGEPFYFDTWRFLFDSAENWAPGFNGYWLFAGGIRKVGNSHLGPALYAIRPWEDGNPPAAGASLGYRKLLQYGTFSGMDDLPFDHPMINFCLSDMWTGGTFLTFGDKASVVLSGTKTGGKHWYGYDDGTPTGYVNFNIPSEFHGEKGPKASYIIPMMIFYDPSDLAAVANGSKQSYEPQPYAALDFRPYFYGKAGQTEDTVLAAVAFDR